jgi:cytochrome c
MMQFRAHATFLIASIIFNMPEAYAADASDGRNVFIKECLACHAFSCNKEGPRLGGLFGRKVATVEDYNFYSQGLKDSDIVWTNETLDIFFTDPAKMFPGSVMANEGEIEDAAQRRNLIAFLETEDSSVNLCPQ